MAIINEDSELRAKYTDNNWATTRFKYLHSGSNVGVSIDKEYWSNDATDIIFYTAGLVPIHTSFKDFPKWKYSRSNDLLLSRNGTPYVYIPEKNSAYSDHIIRVGINDNADKRFVRYSLQQAINNVVVDSVSIATWSISTWDEQRLIMPPLNEQIAIADFLDEKCAEIDKLSEDIQKQIEILEDYKKSVITRAVTKGLSSNIEDDLQISEIDWIGTIPARWNIIRLKNAAWLKGRIGWQGLRADEFKDDISLPYLITGTDFENGTVNWDTCAHITEERFQQDRNIQINEDDLLITKDGTIGKVAIVKNCPQKVSLNSGVFIIRNTGKYKYDSKFLYYVLQSDEFNQWFSIANAGNSTILHLNQEKFYNFAFALPDMEEQKEIASYLDDSVKKIQDAVTMKNTQLSNLADYKKSIIYEYATGKKRVA